MSKSKTTVRDVTKWFLQRKDTNCTICHEVLLPTDDIHWDHLHGEAMGGLHDYTNLRPTHAACNLKKAGDEKRALAKIDRITGKTKGPKSRKIQSKPFDKRNTKRFDGTVVARKR